MLHFLLTIMVGLADLFLIGIVLVILCAIVAAVLGTAKVRRVIRQHSQRRGPTRFVP